MSIDLLLGILLAVGFGFRLYALGLPEEGAVYRKLSLLAVLPITTAVVLGSLRLYQILPFWMALPAILIITAVGFLILYSVISKIVPSKVKRLQ